jgi:hypothetical protein
MRVKDVTDFQLYNWMVNFRITITLDASPICAHAEFRAMQGRLMWPAPNFKSIGLDPPAPVRIPMSGIHSVRAKFDPNTTLRDLTHLGSARSDSDEDD